MAARSYNTFLAFALLGAAAIQAGDAYEAFPVLRASDLAPAALLAGPGFKVADQAPVKAYMPHFAIHSDYAPFSAEGREMLEVRIAEMPALAKLDEVTKGDAFAKAFGQSAKKTGQAVVNVATKPVETAKKVPAGVGRFLKGIGGTAKKAGSAATDAVSSDDEDEPGDKSTGEKAGDAAKGVAGASKAKRGWAKELGVDPYTTNAVLSKKLDDVAWASSAGGFAMSVATMGVPFVGMTTRVNSLAWDMPKEDIDKMNDEKMKKMGVPEKARKGFLSHPFFTPTLAIGFVEALEALGAATGRGDAVALAVRQAKDEEDARFYRRAAQILAGYARTQGPIARLEARKTLFVAHARSGKLVVPVPLDYLPWTKEVADFVKGADRKEPLEVWTSGQLSDRARHEFKARHLTLRESALEN